MYVNNCWYTGICLNFTLNLGNLDFFQPIKYESVYLLSGRHASSVNKPTGGHQALLHCIDKAYTMKPTAQNFGPNAHISAQNRHGYNDSCIANDLCGTPVQTIHFMDL
jgi:hypothetical protein